VRHEKADTDITAFSEGIRDEAHELQAGRSLYERRPCPDCGGPGEGEDGCCAKCNGQTHEPSRRAVMAKAHRDTAAYLRKLERMEGEGYLASMLRVDIAYHEARASMVEK